MLYYLCSLVVLGVLGELYSDRGLGKVCIGILYFITLTPLLILWFIVVTPISIVLRSITYVSEKYFNKEGG